MSWIPRSRGDSDRTAGVEGIECRDVFEGRDGRGVQVVDGGLVARPADAVGAREVLDTGVGGCFEALAVGKDELHRYLLSVERGLMSCPVVGFAAWKAPTLLGERSLVASSRGFEDEFERFVARFVAAAFPEAGVLCGSVCVNLRNASMRREPPVAPSTRGSHRD